MGRRVTEIRCTDVQQVNAIHLRNAHKAQHIALHSRYHTLHGEDDDEDEESDDDNENVVIHLQHEAITRPTKHKPNKRQRQRHKTIAAMMIDKPNDEKKKDITISKLVSFSDDHTHDNNDHNHDDYRINVQFDKFNDEEKEDTKFLKVVVFFFFLTATHTTTTTTITTTPPPRHRPAEKSHLPSNLNAQIPDANHGMQ